MSIMNRRNRRPLGFAALVLILIAPAYARAAGVQLVDRSGASGATVAVEVRLTGEASELVAGAQTDIHFNREQVSVAPVAENNNKPDCRVNPAINKRIDGSETFGFGFLKGSEACDATAEQCDGLRAIVLSTDNVDVIPPGSALFSCNFTIASGLAQGTEIPLTVDNHIGSDPAGQRMAGFTAESGDITVSGAGLCVGDCEPNGEVSIGDLQRGLNIFFGTADVSSCPSIDENSDGVTIGDLQKALNNFFGGCL
jgi:hypothetical protein